MSHATPVVRRMARLEQAAIAQVALVLVAACDKSGPSGKTEPSSRSAPSMTVSVVNARLGCSPIKEGGHVLQGTLEPGVVTVAAARGTALVVNASSAKAERVLLGQGGAPEGPMQPVTEAHGDGEPGEALTWASASLFEGGLATIALGASLVSVAGGSGRCAGGLMVAVPATKKAGEVPKTLATGGCKLASSFVGAARGDFAVGISGGPRGATTVDAIVSGGGKTGSVRVDTGRVGDADSPAVAVGETWAAVAWRSTRGDSPGELRLARLEKDGAKLDKPLVLDTGALGAAALAFEGDTVHVVWSSRTSGKEPYALRWAKWTGKGKPTAPQVLSTRGSAARHPALAVEPSGLFLIAWVEGDDERGVVKAGASKVNLLHAVTSASEVSNPGARARHPAVAVEGPTTYVVWTESTLRATTLRCVE